MHIKTRIMSLDNVRIRYLSLHKFYHGFRILRKRGRELNLKWLRNIDILDLNYRFDKRL